MMRAKNGVTILFVIALMLSLVFAVNAQDSAGTLTVGQPTSGEVEVGGTLNFDYNLTDARAVSLQVVSATAQTAINIKKDGVIVASQPNASGALSITLTTLLNSGSYSVEVASLNDTSGLIMVFVQSETPIEIAQLSLGASVSGEVDTSTPISFFAFDALSEPAYLFFENVLEQGAAFRLINTSTEEIITSTSATITGARVRIAAGDTAYRAEVVHSGSEQSEAFSICYAPVSNAASCDATATTQTPVVEAQPTTAVVTSAACTVTPTFAGGANIRQSSDVNSVVLGVLVGGQSADVLGIAPNGAFYNIQFNNVNGWIALSAVTANGDCANLPVIQPPPALLQTPTPTSTPVPLPTNTPVPPTPTPSGPCLLTLNNPVHVYVIPVEIVDHLQDQVNAGELIPIGRLADNSWWKTNYYNAWVPAYHFGNNLTVSGDCSGLPIVSP